MATVGSGDLVFSLGDTASAKVSGALSAGTLLVENATTGVWENVAIDGTARVGVLLDDIDTATDGDTATVALGGNFNLNKITFGGGQSFGDVKVNLQKFGINLSDSNKA